MRYFNISCCNSVFVISDLSVNLANYFFFFFFLGKPAFIFAYALADIVEFFLLLLVPAFFLLLIFLYKLIFPPSSLLVYVGSDIRAKSKEDAVRILGIISGGEVTEDSEVLSCEEKTLH